MGDQAIKEKGLKVILDEISHYAPHVPYLYSLVMEKEENNMSSDPITVYNLEVTNVDTYVPYYLYQAHQHV